MRSKIIENELLKTIELLDGAQQDKALAFIKSLLQTEWSGKTLLPFAGSIDANSLNEMSAAIEAGCEKIDAHEW